MVPISSRTPSQPCAPGIRRVDLRKALHAVEGRSEQFAVPSKEGHDPPNYSAPRNQIGCNYPTDKIGSSTHCLHCLTKKEPPCGGQSREDQISISYCPCFDLTFDSASADSQMVKKRLMPFPRTCYLETTVMRQIAPLPSLVRNRDPFLATVGPTLRQQIAIRCFAKIRRFSRPEFNQLSGEAIRQLRLWSEYGV
jgi:hypothetical protein